MEKNTVDTGVMRTFPGGATRDTTSDKPEFGGFLSPIVLRAFGEYMNKHRKQPDGGLRDSDNWKKGIPQRVYLESLLRHTLDVHGYITKDDLRGSCLEPWEAIDALMAIIFNAQGLAREILLGRDTGKDIEVSEEFPFIEKTATFTAGRDTVCDRCSPREGCDNCEIKPLTQSDDGEKSCEKCLFRDIWVSESPCKKCYNLPFLPHFKENSPS